MSNEEENVNVPDNQQEECSDEEEKGSDEGNLFYAIWKPHFNHPLMCIVRYISDLMIVPDNQQEECSDEEEKGSDEGNLFYAIWKPHFNHP